MVIQYIPRNMHMVFALLCFVVVIHWLIFPYPSGLLHWHCGNLTIAPVPAKQPWWIWINTSCEFIMNDCITTTKQSTTKPCAYFLGYTVWQSFLDRIWKVKSTVVCGNSTLSFMNIMRMKCWNPVAGRGNDVVPCTILQMLQATTYKRKCHIALRWRQHLELRGKWLHHGISMWMS